MMAASMRPLLIVAFFALLAGCARSTGDGLSSDTLHTALPAAELPSYAKGDRYTLDNPSETWRVADISNDLVTWKSAQSGRQVTMFDPLLPPVSWTRPDGRQGVRTILEWSGSLFPLKTGNKLTFKTAVSVTGTDGHARFMWNCYVGHPRQVTVPAGNFAAFSVFCRRNDGHKTLTYYAPALHRPIAITTRGSKGKPVSRQLVGFEEGKGPRIAASKRESLPGGWSAAAVAEWGKQGLTGPRVPPEALAAANPPLSFASRPGQAAQSGNTQPGRIPPGAADRSRAAERNPARISPQLTSKTGFRAHIGSFLTEERAERGWTLFQRRYGPILENQPHLVAPVELDGAKGTMFRLYAGPLETASQAKSLCEELRTKGGYCRVFAIPTR